MVQAIEGFRITHAFTLASAVGQEVGALVQTLDELIEQGIEASCVRYESFDDADPSTLYDDDDWVCLGYAESFPLITKRAGPGRRRSSPEKYLCYQMSLSGSGTLDSQSPEPLLHVLCLEDAVDFAEDHYLGGSLLTEYTWIVEGDSLIRWLSEEDNETPTGEWAFSVRLTSLNSSQDLEEKIVKPAIALLNGESSRQALSSDLEGLVGFRKEDGRILIQG